MRPHPAAHPHYMTHFIEQVNNHHTTVIFTAEISDNEVTFLDTIVYKGKRFNSTSILDVRTHFKATETFQYTHFSSCHPLARGWERLYKRPSPPATQNKFPKRKLSKTTRRISKAPWREGISTELNNSNFLWNTLLKQERGTPTKTFKEKNHFALCHALSTISS